RTCRVRSSSTGTRIKFLRNLEEMPIKEIGLRSRSETQRVETKGARKFKNNPQTFCSLCSLAKHREDLQDLSHHAVIHLSTTAALPRCLPGPQLHSFALPFT